MLGENDNSPSATISELLDRLPPRNLDAERAVLGCVLLDPDRLLGDFVDGLRENDFQAEAHRLFHKAIVAIQRANLALDVLTLVDRLGLHDLAALLGQRDHHLTAQVPGGGRFAMA